MKSFDGELSRLREAIQGLNVSDVSKFETGKLVYAQRDAMSQDDLADRLGVSGSKVSNYSVTYRQMLEAHAPMTPRVFAAWFTMTSSPRSGDLRNRLIRECRNQGSDDEREVHILREVETFRGDGRGRK